MTARDKASAEVVATAAMLREDARAEGRTLGLRASVEQARLFLAEVGA